MDSLQLVRWFFLILEGEERFWKSLEFVWRFGDCCKKKLGDCCKKKFNDKHVCWVRCTMTLGSHFLSKWQTFHSLVAERGPKRDL
jgi:hypothetical protein